MWPGSSTLVHFLITSGAVLTQEEIEQLMSKLENVTATLQEREKARQKESKVGQSTKVNQSWVQWSCHCYRRMESFLNFLPG